MNWLNKLERKFGKYAIHNLMYYIIILNIVGVILNLFAPRVYETYLSLNIKAVLHGQVWRLVTFLIQPVESNPFFLFIELYLYYMIGSSLENTWGAFRFNLYYLSGIIFNIIAAFIMYSVTGIGEIGQFFGLTYINRSMFFAFAVLYPNIQFLLMFLIPIKVKWLAVLYAVLLASDILTYIRNGLWPYSIAIVVAVANFLIFYFGTRNYKKYSPKQQKRRTAYKKAVKINPGATRHKCTVCGRTELDNENLEFRFCSKCDGNYEYCSEHLFTHQHIKK